jgi:hypothetical protein
MQWPKELIATLARGLDVEPVEGLSREHVYVAFLDETARRAVWRARGDPAKLRLALEAPYTPIGSVTASCVNGLAERLCLHGPAWCDAVEAIYAYMEENAADVCASFQDEWQPYESDLGFGA